MTDSTSFAELASVEIQRRGVETADQLGAVVDGAEWCQTFLNLHAPQIRRILEFPHAAGYVDAIGQTAKLVVQERLKRPGMHSAKANVNGRLALAIGMR